MKSFIRAIGWSAFSVGIGALFAVSGCTEVPSTGWEVRCDSTPFAPNADCAKESASDAGTDANSEGGAGGSGGEAPGLNPSSVFRPDACQTECAPEAEGQTAAGWEDRPVMVWIGPISELKDQQCDVGETYEKFTGYDKLVAPPAKCDVCACLPDGTCADLPEKIAIRSGQCGVSNVESTPFDGPPNWDGSCTSANAMPAGKLCNGVPCAQSVSASALPSPTNESCTPTTEKPNATIEKHEWLEGVLVCGADSPGNCGVDAERCVPKLKDGWLRCVWQDGKHNECPGNYDDFAPRYVYQDNPIDDRGCSSCECGAPKDGICVGSFSVYSDNLCSKQFAQMPLSSMDGNCVGITPAGGAVGSKTITNLSYVPGTCSVTGGEPIGTVIPNDTKGSGVKTICCRAPGPAPLPELQ